MDTITASCGLLILLMTSILQFYILCWESNFISFRFFLLFFFVTAFFFFSNTYNLSVTPKWIYIFLFGERVTAEGLVVDTHVDTHISPAAPLLLLLFLSLTFSVIKYIGFDITPLQDACPHRLLGRLHYYAEKICVTTTKKAVIFLSEEHSAREELNAPLAEENKVLSIWVATKLIGCQLSTSEKSHTAVYGSLPF